MVAKLRENIGYQAESTKDDRTSEIVLAYEVC